MDAITMIKERRSIRKFKNEVVDRNLMKEIVDVSKYAPSWVNYQIARYTFVDKEDIIKRIAKEGVNGFVYNIDTLKEAKNVLVLSYIEGKSGKIEEAGYDAKTNIWEIFDAGIAAQTFSLAAHAKGIGSVIMGVINDKAISEIINLPKGEKVAALIVYGYPEGEHPKAPTRFDTEEIIRFAGE